MRKLVETYTIKTYTGILNVKNLLFGRIRELILSPSIVALSYTTILPKVFDCFNVWGFERSNCFVVNCTYQLRFILNFIWINL